MFGLTPPLASFLGLMSRTFTCGFFALAFMAVVLSFLAVFPACAQPPGLRASGL
jgi:hypothetical protein